MCCGAAQDILAEGGRGEGDAAPLLCRAWGLRVPAAALGGGRRRFFGGVKNGQILPMGDVPLTGAAGLGAEGLPLTGRADFSLLPELTYAAEASAASPISAKKGLRCRVPHDIR